MEALRLLLLAILLHLGAGFWVAPFHQHSFLPHHHHQQQQQQPQQRSPIIRYAENLEEMDREALLEYLNSDGLGLSFQEFQKREQQKHYLEQCPLFRDLSSADCDRMAASLEEVEVKKGTVLIQEGDIKGDAMYFLLEGELIAKSNNTVLTTYQTPGDYFGELALIFKGQARAATIEASKDSKVYQLNKDAFSKSLQDSPVFDTARKMLLKKYSSTRLRDVLRKISINEFLDLLTARLQSKTSNTITKTIFPFSLGASCMVLASIWVGQVPQQGGWPIRFFDWKSLQSTKLPIPLVSWLLTASAILGNASITNDQRPTNQSFRRRLHRLGVWTMIGFCSQYRKMDLFFPLHLFLAIGLDATKDTIASQSDSNTNPELLQPSKQFLPAMVSCFLLGYEAVRNFVGA